MKLFRKIGQTAAILFLCGPALPEPSPEGISYDCDTAPGRFSLLKLPSPGGPFTVSGQVEVVRIAEDKQWGPIARLQLVQGKSLDTDPKPNAVGFSLLALKAKRVNPDVKDDKLVVQFLEWNETVEGTEKQYEPFGMSTNGGKIPFSLTFDGAKVDLQLACQNKTLPFADSRPTVRILCSTGEFVFSDLRIIGGN